MFFPYLSCFSLSFCFLLMLAVHPLAIFEAMPPLCF